MTLHTTVPRHHCRVFPKFEGCGLNREEKRDLHSCTENAGSLPGKSAVQIKEELKDGEKKGTFAEKKGMLGWPRLAGHMQTNKPKPSILLLPAEVAPLLPQSLPRHPCPAAVPEGGPVPPCSMGTAQWTPGSELRALSVALGPPGQQGHSCPLAAGPRRGRTGLSWQEPGGITAQAGLREQDTGRTRGC